MRSDERHSYSASRWLPIADLQLDYSASFSCPALDTAHDLFQDLQEKSIRDGARANNVNAGVIVIELKLDLSNLQSIRTWAFKRFRGMSLGL